MKMNANFLSTASPYQSPSFLSHISPSLLPTQKLSLGHFPTPIHKFNIPMDLHGLCNMYYRYCVNHCRSETIRLRMLDKEG